MCLVVFRPEGKPFDTHSFDLMEAQARALGLPLYQVVLPSSEPYRDAYVDAIRSLRDDRSDRDRDRRHGPGREDGDELDQ